MAAGKSRVKVEGVRECQAALKKLEAASKDMSGVHKSVASGLLPGIALRTPRRSGRLAASWGAGATKTRAKITSSAPYSGVIEYGWAKRGITPARMVGATIEAEQKEIVAAYEHEIAELAKRIGFEVKG